MGSTPDAFKPAPERQTDTEDQKPPSSGFRRKLGWLFTVLAGAFVVAVNLDDGINRSVIFWSRAGPIYLHYRYTQLISDYGFLTEEESNERFNWLHSYYSPIVEHNTLKLRGFYLKQAQLLSTRDDFVPEQYLNWCKKTQDNVPSEITADEARTIFKQQIGRDVDEVFEYWEDEPFAVASIGQVHKARLPGGQEVAVKIQTPHIERRFRADLNTVRAFCKLAMPHHVPAFDEIEKQFMTEFDYVLEAYNLDEIHDHMASWAKLIAIPKPFHELCSKEVLTMEYLAGQRLVDGIRQQYREYAATQNMTLEELEHEQKEKLRLGLIKKRTVDEEDRMMTRASWALVVKDSVFSLNALRLLYNVSPLRLCFGSMDYQWTKLPLNLGRILSLLSRVHAYEIFQCGCFNGDPHPGNVLLMDDGRLGLIDYGQVKHLALGDRITYAKLVIALARDDRAEVARLAFEDLGIITKYKNPEIAYKLMCFWNDRDTDDITAGMNLQVFMDWAQAQDPLITANDEIIMCSRVSVMMRGMANAFNLRVRTAPEWRPYAQQLLRDHGIDY